MKNDDGVVHEHNSPVAMPGILAGAKTPPRKSAQKGGVGELFRVFLKLGLISFGGPVAHLSYFHEELVMRRRWLDEDAFGDLVALSQFLPGPASSQLVFALGMRRAGLAGALTASISFTMPSAMLMILFAYGISSLGDLREAGWIHGLKLAAVAVVAQAVWGMGRRLCPDRVRLTLCLGAAALVLIHPGAIGQVGAILIGGMVGWGIFRRETAENSAAEKLPVKAHWIAAGCLGAFFGLLALLPVAASAIGSPMLAMFDSFYRAGALVFGGGHVVLPLLRVEVVPRGWVSDDVFLAGYGAAQAVPGPLFTFAAFLGTAIRPGAYAWANGLWCLLAIFLPGWLIMGGVLPFWDELRKKGWMQAALRGANATVVGVLLAALYTPVMTQGVKGPRDLALALAAFTLLEIWKTPAWGVVALMAAAGAVW